jgi:hypothetical protein
MSVTIQARLAQCSNLSCLSASSGIASVGKCPEKTNSILTCDADIHSLTVGEARSRYIIVLKQLVHQYWGKLSVLLFGQSDRKLDVYLRSE